jgi:predicted PurR-regulated permease PerM
MAGQWDGWYTNRITVTTLLVSSIDNVLRPYLLGKTGNLPVVLGLFGFVGGILAFGFIGVFLGPTLLALGYTLFLEWNAAEVQERRFPTPVPSDTE